MAEDLHRRQRVRVIASVAIVGGLLLGSIDLIGQRALPYPWANLANSGAVWAVGAFAIGLWVGTGRSWLPAAAGVVLLLVAVESYYLTATLVQHDELANLWTTSTAWWLLFGVLAGVVFGTAGGWAGGAHRWRRIVGVALPGAALLAESALLVHRSTGMAPAYRVDSLETAAVEAALGVLCVLVFGRDTRQRLAGLAACALLAVPGFGALVATGFAG